MGAISEAERDKLTLISLDGKVRKRYAVTEAKCEYCGKKRGHMHLLECGLEFCPWHNMKFRDCQKIYSHDFDEIRFYQGCRCMCKAEPCYTDEDDTVEDQ